MPENSARFIGDIPSQYDSGLGPNIFHDYADRLAALCSSFAASDVLELAAGTGIVSQRLRDRLASECRLTVTDLNQPMLELAEGKTVRRTERQFPDRGCNGAALSG